MTDQADTPDPIGEWDETQAAGDGGWWAISAVEFLAALRRCADGESADVVYAEYYANSTQEKP